MSKFIMIFIGAALLAGGVLACLLNHDSSRQQAADIVAADNASQPTAAAVSTLETYVGSHMAASVDVDLAAGYARAKAAAAQPAGTQSIPNAQIYAAAQAACAGHTDSITQARCVQAYVSARLVAEPSVTPTPIPVAPVASDYTYNLRSPFWTGDAAGILLLAGLVMAVTGTISLLIGRKTYA